MSTRTTTYRGLVRLRHVGRWVVRRLLALAVVLLLVTLSVGAGSDVAAGAAALGAVAPGGATALARRVGHR